MSTSAAASAEPRPLRRVVGERDRRVRAEPRQSHPDVPCPGRHRRPAPAPDAWPPARPSVPALPVAPRISTDCPGWIGHPAAQSDPGRHRRVHCRGDLRHVGSDGSSTMRLTSTTARSAIVPGHVVGGHEVDRPPVRKPADTIDAGDHRQHAGGRVVRPGRAAADARVQPDGEHVDQRLVTDWSAAAPGRPRNCGGRSNELTTAACMSMGSPGDAEIST